MLFYQELVDENIAYNIDLLFVTLNTTATGSFAAAELELVVLAKLELSTIQKQRHLSTTSAEVVTSAMEALQQSEIFSDEDTLQDIVQPR